MYRRHEEHSAIVNASTERVFDRLDDQARLSEHGDDMVRAREMDLDGSRIGRTIYGRTMSLTNFQLNSDFKWLLLIPPLLWVIGLVVRSRIRTRPSP